MKSDMTDILLVEDNPGDAELIRLFLEEGFHCHYQLTHCQHLHEALAHIDRTHYDVILLDLSLPDSSGLATFKSVHNKAQRVPIVILTGFDDLAMATCAMQGGAQDYLPKNTIDSNRLARTLRYAIERKHWEESIRLREEHITQMEKMDAISRLGRGLAHNFNNLLTALIGNCELLIGRVHEDAKALRYAEVIEKDAQRAASLTRQLLSLCTRQVSHLQPTSINQAVTAVEVILRGTMSKDVSVFLELEDDLPPIMIDRNQLETALINLVRNAHEAMIGAGRISVTTHSIDLEQPSEGFPDRVPEGSYVTISVSDTGGGIDAVILPHIFKPFFSTKEAGKRSGLGLSTVIDVVRKNHGFVQVGNSPDGGAMFRLFFHRPQLPDMAAAEEARPAQQNVRTILLIEDEAQICAVLAEFLSSQGYRILVAANGEEAQRLFNQNQAAIKLAICDIDIPGFNGYELAQLMKYVQPNLKIIFVSGEAVEPEDGDDDENGVEGLISARLTKPFSSLTLANTIKDLWQPWQSSASEQRLQVR
jgi:two-component system, cell cycle sensor histidine kinase and response regulator CckA